MIEQSYQLVVIGDHLGGLAAAALGAKRGKRVLLLEDAGEPPEQRPLEYLNAICGGPEREEGLGSFFHELGLSPFGPLGDDRIHFRPLLPPLQVILPEHRVNIYQDRVARNWEMEREFGDVREQLKRIHGREEEFRERLSRFRAHRAGKRTGLRRVTGEMGRFFRFQALKKEVEKETFAELLTAGLLPDGLGDVLAGEVCGVTRLLSPAMPWYAGLRAIGVLQGGLFRNAAGQSGIVSGLREAFLRAGGESRPLSSLESIGLQRADAVGLHLSADARVQTDSVIVDLPLERAMGFFQAETVRGLQKKGLDRKAAERSYAILRLEIRRGWKPECMGEYLVIDPSLSDRGAGATIFVAVQPGDQAGGQESCTLEALGIFPSSLRDGEEQARVIWDRLEALMPFLGQSVVGDRSLRNGHFPVYETRNRSWRHLESYYRSGRRPASYATRGLTFLRNEHYIGTGLAEGLLSGIRSVPS